MMNIFLSAQTFSFRSLHLLTLTALVLALSCKPQAQVDQTSSSAPSAGSVVKVNRTSAGFSLLVNGKAFKIDGVGGGADTSHLTSLGGNSIRTWGADDLGKVLDKAQQQGLMVTAGIWLEHREGFDYHDPAKVKAQLEMCRKVVQQYKNHPALLMWSFGNEEEGDGKDPVVFQAVNDIAVMSHQEDPNHPVMTVVAEVGAPKLENLKKYCPDVDIIGINSYAGGPSLAERFNKEEVGKPYIVTELGPPGQWEVAKTSWGAPLEPTSTAKAEAIAKSYNANVVANAANCLGSYVFLWGNKVEGTPTWFGLFLKNDSKVAAADTIADLWEGKTPTSECPSIEPITLDGPPDQAPGSVLHAKANGSGFTSAEWTLIGELKNAGADPNRPSPVDELSSAVSASQDGKTATVTLPNAPGSYRLMLVLKNDKGSATANVPLHVRGKTVATSGQAGKLPLDVYADGDAPLTFQPTGWMGDTAAMKLSLNETNNPHSGRTCISFSFNDSGNWGGIAWQYPSKDWGDKPDSINLIGAKKLTFWMRGTDGGEKVKVQFGILGSDKAYPDSGTGTSEVVLSKDWQQFSIDCIGQDMSHIKTGFVFTVGGIGHPQTIFIDDVRYE
jgi:Glycosyl hydrolases family 2, TIM barrel domain